MSYQIRFLDEELEAAFSDPRHRQWSRRGMPPRTFKAASSTLEKLRQAPYSVSWLYPGREEGFGGLRGADIPVKGRGRFRIYFKTCEECRKRQDVRDRNVIDCCRDEVKTQNKTVNVFFIADPH